MLLLRIGFVQALTAPAPAATLRALFQPSTSGKGTAMDAYTTPELGLTGMLSATAP
ncbi:hypothetical protein [Ideonella sp. BN130291]|uniref:hypothetical protein n=1 Tax=Ideonella sp. BN130291 TaxID=3112940 RepID=UPI002E260359|nr:hypothetical protein [Ideonella sp. BN130291]